MTQEKLTVESATREKLILERRLARVPFRKIAEELDLSVTRVVQLYQKSLQEIPALEAAEMRSEESDLIDTAVTRLTHIAETAEKESDRIAAWGQVARYMERRAKLFGLDAAQKIAVTGGVTYSLVGVDPDQV